MKNYENINEYIEAYSSPEGDYLYRLYRATNVEILNPHMASGHIQGRLLKLLVKMIRPKRILEIGTYTGYSALCMAEGPGQGQRVHDHGPQPADPRGADSPVGCHEPAVQRVRC